MSKPQSPNLEKLHKAALFAVACNTIMLTVCDDLKETSLYKQRVKQLVNELTKELEKFVEKMYKGISPEEKQQYNNLVRLVESTASLVAGMAPSEIHRFQALIKAYRNGEIFEATTDKQMNNLINQKRVKPLTTKEFVRPATGTVPFP